MKSTALRMLAFVAAAVALIALDRLVRPDSYGPGEVRNTDPPQVEVPPTNEAVEPARNEEPHGSPPAGNRPVEVPQDPEDPEFDPLAAEAPIGDRVAAWVETIARESGLRAESPRQPAPRSLRAARRLAALTLAAEREPHEVERVLTLLVQASGDAKVRLAAALGLGAAGGAEGMKTLGERALADAEPSVREAAVEALSAAAHPDAAAALGGVLARAEDPYLRERAAAALGARRQAEGIGPLRDALARETLAWVRARVVEAIAEIGGADVHADLHARVAGDPAEEVRARALRGLARLAAPGTAALAEAALEKDERPAVRAEAARVLGLLQGTAAREALQRAAGGDEAAEVREAARAELRKLGE